MNIIKDYYGVYNEIWGEEPKTTQTKTNYLCLEINVESQFDSYIFIKDGNPAEVAKLTNDLYEECREHYAYIGYINNEDIDIWPYYLDPEIGEKIFTVLSEEYRKIKIKEDKEKIFFNKYMYLKTLIEELKIPDFIPYEEDNSNLEKDLENLNKICSKVAEENNVTYENGCFYFENIKFASIELCGYTHNSYAKLAWDYNPENQ